MEKSDFQELLAALYLRLNGYFSSGFIAHAASGNLTEIDIIAVRFPNHSELEREVKPCACLHPPNDCIDVVVGEVKGGKNNPNFNPNFYERPEAVRKVLNRIGAFSKVEIDNLVPRVCAIARPESWRRNGDFPVIPVPNARAQLRLVLFAPDQLRNPKHTRPAVHGDDMINFIWQCFRPDEPRKGCAIDYNATLWGHQFNPLVAYFKDWSRYAPGDVDEIYAMVSRRCGTPNS